MISYKLAKKLRDAGFPQIARGGAWWLGSKVDVKEIGSIEAGGIIALKEPQKLYYAPLLSELIKACGEDFGRLDRFPNCWEAEGGKLINIKHCSYEYLTQGRTSEEAVGELLLKLLKKNGKKKKTKKRE